MVRRSERCEIMPIKCHIYAEGNGHFIRNANRSERVAPQLKHSSSTKTYLVFSQSLFYLSDEALWVFIYLVLVLPIS